MSSEVCVESESDVKIREHVSAYFNEMDVDFVNIKDTRNLTYRYTATNVVLQPGKKTLEVPIILSFPNSKVHFEFATDPADIKFGICFVAALEEGQSRDDLEVETIEEMDKVVCSLQEPVIGSFDCACEGVVFFMFENEAEWWTTGGSVQRELAYIIEVHSPNFTTIDEERCFRAKTDLADALDKLEVSSIRLADAEVMVERTTEEVAFLEEQISALSIKLEERYVEFEASENALDEALEVLSSGYSRINGLCIRMLNKHLLSLLISFTDVEGPSALVSKYWNELAKNNQVARVGGAERVFRVRGAVEAGGGEAYGGGGGGGGEEEKEGGGAGGGIYLTPAEKLEKALKMQQQQQQQQQEVEGDEEKVTTHGDHNGHRKAPKEASSSSSSTAATTASSATKQASSSSSSSSSSSPSTNNMFMTTPSRIQKEVVPVEDFVPHSSTAANGAQKARHKEGNRAVTAAAGGESKKEEEEEEEEVLVAGNKSKDANAHAQKGVASPAPASKPSSSSASRRDKAQAAASTELLKDIKSIRSEKQLRDMLEYIGAGYEKIETLNTEKRRIKKILKAWNASFEKRNGRAATKQERKEFAGGYYEEYQLISYKLHSREQKMDKVLNLCGITKEDYELLLSQDRHIAPV